MRLTRLLGMNEVRRTAGSDPKRAGGQARPEQEVWPEDGGAWGGWRRNVWKCTFGNQGDLSGCWKEQGRSQSPHSSDEAGNDRGAKGDRKVEAGKKHKRNSNCRECRRLNKAEKSPRNGTGRKQACGQNACWKPSKEESKEANGTV